MLQDLDKTVEELLRRQLPPEVVRQVSFSFGTPDKESIKTTPAINLFLYDVRENLELRSNVEVLQRQSNDPALKNRPSALDCSDSLDTWGSRKCNGLERGHIMSCKL
jgi:hypothetical protein